MSKTVCPGTNTGNLPVRSAFFGGCISVIVQAVVLREALFGQHQAELASGMVIASWIICSGFGAAFAGGFSNLRRIWIAGMALLPLLGLLQVVSSRMGILHPAFSALPVGFVAGSVFIAPFSSGKPGRIYGLEALGAAVGGGVFVLLSPIFLSPEILAAALLIAAAGFMLCRMIVPGLVLSGLFLISMILGAPWELSHWMGSMIPGEYSSVNVYPSPYGEIVTAQRSGQFAVYRSGLLEASWPSLESAECIVTVPLLISMPERAMYIGSSPEEIELISHWPGVVRCFSVIPDAALGNVVMYLGETVEGDGRNILADNREEWDLILVSTGPPLTLLSNRFYTREFMDILSSRISADGVIAIRLPGGINRLHPLEARLAATVANSARESFSWTIIVPSSGLLLLAGHGPEPSFDGSLLATRMDSIGAEGVFVNSGTLPFDLSQMRLEAIEDQVQAAEAGLNTDLKPHGFLLAHMLWDFREGKSGDTQLLLIISVLLLMVMVSAGLLTGTFRLSLAVGIVGFSGLSVEVIALVAVQSATGYSWMLVGAITGIFMAGAALGALLQYRERFRSIRAVIILAAAAVLISAVALHLYDQSLVGGTTLSIFLLAGVFLSGLASGGAFPLVAEKLGIGRTSRIGLLDLAEHGGSATAAIVMPLILFSLVGAAPALLFSLAGLVVVLLLTGNR